MPRQGCGSGHREGILEAQGWPSLQKRLCLAEIPRSEAVVLAGVAAAWVAACWEHKGWLLEAVQVVEGHREKQQPGEGEEQELAPGVVGWPPGPPGSARTGLTEEG